MRGFIRGEEDNVIAGLDGDGYPVANPANTADAPARRKCLVRVCIEFQNQFLFEFAFEIIVDCQTKRQRPAGAIRSLAVGARRKG